MTDYPRRRQLLDQLMQDLINNKPAPLSPLDDYWGAFNAHHEGAVHRPLAEAIRAKLIDPSLGVPWEEGHTQRGNGSGGPTTAKPPINPQPSGGRMIDQYGMTIGYQPLPRLGRTIPPPRKPQFPPPRIIREDLL